MVIIDFEKKGNIVRFYLGEKTKLWGWTNPKYQTATKNGLETPSWLKPCDRYYGDDWDDVPYEHNAGSVYSEFIKGYVDINFGFDALVLEPSQSYDNSGNSRWCKYDMEDRSVPCIIVVPKELTDTNYSEDFNFWVQQKGVRKIFFGDELPDNNQLNIIKDIYDNQINYVLRQAKYQTFSKEHLEGILDGIAHVFSQIIAELPDEAFPKIERLTSAAENDPVAKINVFNSDYFVYLDDPGQCFYVKIDDKEYSLGTYNTLIEPDVVYLIFQNIHKINTAKLEDTINDTI